MTPVLPNLPEIFEGRLILVDKPINWTSFDVVNKLKWLVHSKIGHCGTLDPLATGLLLCCTGKMTKEIQFLQKVDKEYVATIQLGSTTPSYDLETSPENFTSFQHLEEKDIIKALHSFLGVQEQIPPIHSAIKKDGVRAYKLARAGETVVLKPRTVTFKELEILNIDLNKGQVKIRIHCSTGTYIRSFAHDLGQCLKVGGHLIELIRTKVGDYLIENALSIEQWVAYLEEQNEQYPEIKANRLAQKKNSRRRRF